MTRRSESRQLIKSVLSVSFCVYRVAAGALFIVVDEDIVPSDGSHVKCVKSTKDPQKRNQNQRREEDMEATVEATTARGTFL